MNYYIPGYFDGFHRRALIGTILSFFGDIRFNFYFITALQIAISGTLIFLLLREAIKQKPTNKVIFILFFIAPTGSFLFHEFGFVEHLLYLMLFAALSFRKIGFLLMVTTLFIHEEAFFCVIPIYLCIQYFQSVSRTKIVLQGLVFLICFLYLIKFGVESDIVVDNFTNLLKSKVNYPAADYYYDLYKTKSEIKICYRPGQIFEIVIIFMLGFYLSKLFTKNSNPFDNWLIIFTIFAPVILGFIGGTDTSRWFQLSFGSALVLLSYLVSEDNSNYFDVYFVLIFFAVFGNFYFFDGTVPRRVDFDKQSLQFILHDFKEMTLHAIDNRR
ncbi:MAG: hypothetical protein ABSB19_12325 [Methylomonas sp.]